jgi:hypothetical protein
MDTPEDPPHPRPQACAPLLLASCCAAGTVAVPSFPFWQRARQCTLPPLVPFRRLLSSLPFPSLPFPSLPVPVPFLSVASAAVSWRNGSRNKQTKLWITQEGRAQIEQKFNDHKVIVRFYPLLQFLAAVVFSWSHSIQTCGETAFRWHSPHAQKRPEQKADGTGKRAQGRTTRRNTGERKGRTRGREEGEREQRGDTGFKCLLWSGPLCPCTTCLLLGQPRVAPLRVRGTSDGIEQGRN